MRRGLGKSKGRARKTSGHIVEMLESRLLLSGNSATPAMGINIRRLGYDSGDELFADAMKEPGAWSTNLVNPSQAQGVNDPAPIDASGWPTTDAAIEVIANNSDDGGTYSLSFTGAATVSPSASESAIQIANQAYNAGNNTTTAQVIVPAGAEQLMLDFTNTRRLPTDTTATGITNVQLMRPISPDASTSYPSTTLFTTPILNLISNFSVIRFMDYSLTNSNPQVNWTDRTIPAEVQTDGKGGAWEYAVALANQTGKDMWINIPEMATTAYITDLAELIDYGSDGVNPYTGQEGSAVSASNPNPIPASGPVWAGLNPNLHVYLEYSNEVWSSSNAQYGENLNAAVASVNAGNSPLDFDDDGSEYDWAVRRTAQMIMQTSEIFRGVFGDDEMMSRIRPVYEWQYANDNDTAALGLEFLNEYYNNADGLQHVTDPHPVDYYLWGGGGAWYGGVNNSVGSGDVTVPQGTFAAPTVSGYQADPSGSDWAFTGTAGIAANGSSLENPASTTGSQAAYIQGNGSFTETVDFSGGLADLAFSAASGGTESFTVSIDGTNVTNTPLTMTSSYAAQNTLAFDTGVSAGPHVVTFTGISGTGTVFISNVTADTANAMYNSGIQNITSTIQSEVAWATAFGLQMTSYEGGFVFGTGNTGTPLQIAANQDPRAQAAEVEQMDEFYAAGGALAMYYDTTNHIWALTLDIDNQTTPKIQAVESVLSSPQPALNFGTILPTTAGQSVTVANSLPAYSDAAGLYVLDATAAGTYSLTLTGEQSGAEVEQFFLDGQAIAGLTALPTSASGSSSPALTFTIATPGLHALLLVPQGSGSITPANPAGSITVTAGAGPALPAVPAAPTNLKAASSGLAQVNLTWNASASATGYSIQRSANGGSYIIVGSSTTASYSDGATAPGVSYVYQVFAYNSGGLGAASAPASITTLPANVPAPWSDADVGTPWIAGYANYTAATATWTVAGGGIDIWNSDDEFNFLSQSLTGDGTIIARVVSVTAVNSLSAGGVMFRASSSAGDMFVDLIVQASGGLAFTYRTTAGGNAQEQLTSTSIAAPQWIELVRSGNTFTASYSSNGVNWTTVGTPVTISLPSTALVGLVATAHNNALRTVATFTNVSVTTPTTTPISTTTTINTDTPNPSNTTQAVTFSVTVTGGVPNGETVSLVDASNGNAAVATGTLSSGSATIVVPAGTLSVGSHSIVAAYGGDSNYAASTSPAVAQTVNAASPTSGSYDFGTATSPVASGYTQVTAATVYGSALGYGWLSGTIAGYDTGITKYTNPDPNVTRDFNYTTSGTFQASVANGSYDVTLFLGDARGYSYSQSVAINGAAEGTVTTGGVSAVLSKTYLVTVTTGLLDVALASTVSKNYAVLDGLSFVPATPPPASMNFDFGTSASPVAAGWTQVANSTAYGAALGYGWTSTSAVLSYDTGITKYTTPDPSVTRDFNYTHGDTFEVNLADGAYTVSVTLGDARDYAYNMNLSLEGAAATSVATTTAQPIVTEVYTVMVVNNLLTVNIGSSGNSWGVIDGLSIVAG